jgi:ABC-type ATPase fused to a predicted acetyltransferase domain
MQQLNQQLSIINRIVIHPKYRTIGLGEKLIHDTLPQAGTPYVEMVVVMAKYSPFAEKAGMKKIAEQQTQQELKPQTQIVAKLGFNLQLIGSQQYVLSVLQSLNEKQIIQLKTAFAASKHPRFKREVASSRHDPYGKTAEYIKYVQEADHQKLAKLIRILAMLSQTKVYLLWENTTRASTHSARLRAATSATTSRFTTMMDAHQRSKSKMPKITAIDLFCGASTDYRNKQSLRLIDARYRRRRTRHLFPNVYLARTRRSHGLPSGLQV